VASTGQAAPVSARPQPAEEEDLEESINNLLSQLATILGEEDDHAKDKGAEAAYKDSDQYGYTPIDLDKELQSILGKIGEAETITPPPAPPEGEKAAKPVAVAPPKPSKEASPSEKYEYIQKYTETVTRNIKETMQARVAVRAAPMTLDEKETYEKARMLAIYTVYAILEAVPTATIAGDVATLMGAAEKAYKLWTDMLKLVSKGG
jgi:hypothetical protein